MRALSARSPETRPAATRNDGAPGPGLDASTGGMMRPMPSQYSFPCTYCGADCPCPEYIVTGFAGRTGTRWCETCQRLFDIRIPLAPPSEAQS
jgi:hypothetical protein